MLSVLRQCGSVVVDLLSNVLPFVCGSSVFVFIFLCIILCHSNFAIILKRKRRLAALLVFSYRGIVTINVMWLFLPVPWIDLQCVIVVFPDHTHFFINGCVFH